MLIIPGKYVLPSITILGNSVYAHREIDMVKAKAKATKVSKATKNDWAFQDVGDNVMRNAQEISANIQKNAQEISANIRRNAEEIGNNVRANSERVGDNMKAYLNRNIK